MSVPIKLTYSMVINLVKMVKENFLDMEKNFLDMEKNKQVSIENKILKKRARD